MLAQTKRAVDELKRLGFKRKDFSVQSHFDGRVRAHTYLYATFHGNLNLAYNLRYKLTELDDSRWTVYASVLGGHVVDVSLTSGPRKPRVRHYYF